MDKIRKALEQIAIGPWMNTRDARDIAREALALLDAPVTSDARELADKLVDGVVRRVDKYFTCTRGTHAVNSADSAFSPGDRHDIAQAIEAYAAERERKAREETAKKCAERAVGYAESRHFIGIDSERDQWDLDYDELRADIMEIAK